MVYLITRIIGRISMTVCRAVGIRISKLLSAKNISLYDVHYERTEQKRDVKDRDAIGKRLRYERHRIFGRRNFRQRGFGNLLT